MPKPRQMNGQTVENQNIQELPTLTPKQQQKQDALDLAELIYNIFHYGLSSATMSEEDRKDNQNV